MHVTHCTGNAVFALSAGIDVLVAWALVAWAARERPLLPRLAAALLGLLTCAPRSDRETRNPRLARVS